MMSTTYATAIEPVLIEFEALIQTDAAVSRAKARAHRARAQLRTLLFGYCDVALDRRGDHRVPAAQRAARALRHGELTSAEQP